MKNILTFIFFFAACAAHAQTSQAVMETSAGITGNKTFLDNVFMDSSATRITADIPPYWGNDVSTAGLWGNGEGIYFCQAWDLGYTVITANEGLFLVVDKNSTPGNEGVMGMDVFPRAGHGVGFGFSGGIGMFFGDTGALAHWQKTASISPDLRRLYINNTTVALDWGNRLMEGAWTANGTTFAISGNATERGAQLTRWRGSVASDPATPEGGDMYWNTSNSTLRIYNGSTFINLN